jgi:hypothetical protein
LFRRHKIEIYLDMSNGKYDIIVNQITDEAMVLKPEQEAV